MNSLNFFNSIENLEPKCPGCGIKIDYGLSTDYSEKHNTHICKCGNMLK